MGKGSTDRGGRTDVRQRRAFQRLGGDPFSTLGMEAGSGVVFDSALGTISVDLATNPGLAFSVGDLTIDLRDTTPALELTANGVGVIVGDGLELTATGVEVDLATNPGLAFSVGDLTIDLRDTTPALELTANGVGVIVGDGLELTATGVEVDLAATSPGLEFSSGDLRVKIKSAGGITRDADGLSLTTGGTAASGTYTPTITNGTNVASSTPRNALWVQQGDIVTVYTRVDVTPTSANVDTIMNVSLPVAPAANFGGFFEAFGSMSYHFAPADGVSGIIFSESGAVTVRAVFYPTSTVAKGMYLVFSYDINQ